jgi:hypothetical protein
MVLVRSRVPVANLHETGLERTVHGNKGGILFETAATNKVFLDWITSLLWLTVENRDSLLLPKQISYLYFYNFVIF